MNFYSVDDCFLHRNSQFNENIDYLTPDKISYLHLHLCWRENKRMNLTGSSDDSIGQHAFIESQRLRNVAWRKWSQSLWKLAELPPSIINWNKSLDITWLYGPKYFKGDLFEHVSIESLTRETFSTLEGLYAGKFDNIADDSDEHSSLNSNCSFRSMSFDDRSSVGSEIMEVEELSYNLRSALKSKITKPLTTSSTTTTIARKKNVKFNFIVNSREFMNGLSFDYHYLDTMCL